MVYCEEVVASSLLSLLLNIFVFCTLMQYGIAATGE